VLLGISAVKKSHVKWLCSLTQSFPKERTLFDCYPFSFSLEQIMVLQVCHITQPTENGFSLRQPSRTAEEQMIHTSPSSRAKQRRMEQDKGWAEWATNHSKHYCSVLTHAIKIMVISVFCNIPLPAWT